MDVVETLVKDVTTLLNKLGAFGTAEQIRDYFVQEQITGVRRSSQQCPVHNYLVRELGSSRVPIGVGTGQTTVGVSSVPLTSAVVIGGISVTHPEPVRRFIGDFDNCNKYSELAVKAEGD